MKDLTETYYLQGFQSDNLPIKHGFHRNGIFKVFVYKDIIQFIINVDIDENWWGYQVYNVDTQSLYAPYYVRDCGKNLTVIEIDEEIEKVMKKLVKAKIFKENKHNGKESS